MQVVRRYIMHCIKYNKEVLVENCEECHTERKCDPVCVKREFVWGVPDNNEPRWVHSYEAAKAIDSDVSYFFDPKWEGNAHLMQRVTVDTSGYKKTPIPPHIRGEVWERDEFTCQMCGVRKYLSVDHIYPESAGGDLSMENLQTLCKSCNSKKGSKIVSA